MKSVGLCSILFLVLAVSFSASAETPAPRPNQTPNAKKFVRLPVATPTPTPTPGFTPEELAVRTALIKTLTDAKPKLGNLEPWQAKLFDEEVLDHPTRFVKNYRAETGGGVVAEADTEVIRRYLAFSAPKVFHSPQMPVLVLFKVEKGCTKCAQVAPTISEMLKSRLLRRGFVWMPYQSETEPSLAMVRKQYRDWLGPKGAVGMVWMSVSKTPLEDLDTSHGHEVHYRVQLFTGFQTSESDGKLDLTDTDVIETYASRMVTDAFTDMGEQALEKALESDMASGEEILLTVKGVKDFAQFSKIRDNLKNALRDVAEVEEKKLKRGAVVFSIRSKQTPTALRGILVKSPIPDVKWNWKDSGDNNAWEAEIRP